MDSRETEFENLSNGASFLDLSEKENASSLEVTNTLEAEQEPTETNSALLRNTEISDMLISISPDLNNRWEGALFSLNPENPDAARHFCTSAREVFVQMIDTNAPDNQVLNINPECSKTPSGSPTRREKISFMLQKAGIINDMAVEFVNEDVNNVLDLFKEFNDGTHGSSGKFNSNQLLAIKSRVENGITYLSSICSHA